MKRFTELYVRLDQTNSTNEKLLALTDYFAIAAPEDAAWAVWFLSGRRLKRLLKRASLRRWVLEETGYSAWMLDETYQSVGDLAETIALLLPEPEASEIADTPLTEWVRERLLPLAKMPEQQQGEQIKAWWRALPGEARFVLNKMITGALRVGVSQRLVTRALALHLERDSALIAHRMMGDWQPSAQFMQSLADGSGDAASMLSLPYPFFLASPLGGAVETLGERDEWQAEWKWDGIRAQLIRRDNQTFIWSRGEERMDGRFPELEALAEQLPNGTVLDGEILARDAAGEFSFSALQRRIGRLKPGAKLLKETAVVFMAYDLLEQRGRDQREQALAVRRAALNEIVTRTAHARLLLSPVMQAVSWSELSLRRAESRARGVEGLMLKHRDSPYATGRRRGSWWKWKIDPYTIDAVLLYAQPGSGRRSNLLTDYTFAVWDDDQLVPVCKAYSGLSNEEIAKVDRWIRQNTSERFGPVRAVTPKHVFEIAFEGIALSKRHKSGVAFRFPRIARWRHDLKIADAETLPQVKQLIGAKE